MVSSEKPRSPATLTKVWGKVCGVVTRAHRRVAEYPFAALKPRRIGPRRAHASDRTAPGH
jgi:hypothetical protein